MEYYDSSRVQVINNNISGLGSSSYYFNDRTNSSSGSPSLDELFAFPNENENHFNNNSHYAVPSNVQPELDLNFTSEITHSSPSQEFLPSQLESGSWDTLPSSNEIENNEVINGLSVNIVNTSPTQRALKAKRRPTNKCECGGKSSCKNSLCVQAVGCFSCPVCGIEFSRKNSMRRHVLTHINLRPYECNACNKSFYRSDIYKRHLASKRCRRNASQAELLAMCHSKVKSPLM